MKLCDYAGWWCSDASKSTLHELLTEDDFDLRYQSWEKMQTIVFEEVPNVYLGQTSDVIAHSVKLQGVTSQAQLSTILWNAWLNG
jgi:ABC-type transport system substrate-binding protein